MDGQYNSQAYQPPNNEYQSQQPSGQYDTQQPYMQQPYGQTYAQQPYTQQPYGAQPYYQQGPTVAQQVEYKPQYPSPEMAGQGYNESNQQEKLAEDSEANVEQTISDAMRAGFVRKVYGILSIQLLITVLLVGIAMTKKVGEWFQEGEHFVICTVIGSIGMIVFCGCVACTYCIKECKRIEYFLLTGFTLCMSLLLMALCAQFETKVVIIAAALTAMVTISLTAYSCRMTTSFAFCGAFLFAFVGCFVLSLIFMIVAIAMPKFCTWWYILICFMGVLLFSLYIIYDTQLILGKLGIAFGIDDYIIAAMNIYLDIINLFLYILRIVAAAKGNS